MDFAAFLLIPMSAAVTMVWIIGAALFGREPTFRGPFLVSYAVAFLLMQPWLIASWREGGMVAVMMGTTAISIAAGWIAGAIPAMVVVTLVRRMARLRR